MNLKSTQIAKAITLLVIALFSFNVQAQEIKWLSFEEAIEKSKENPKKIIIDLYTDWCKWCKVMDKNTFAHPVIAKYINENYYAVKFNAESTEPVSFQGHNFENQKRGNRSPHDLAIALTQGKLSYPTYVFMDEQHQIIHVQPGYIKPKQFEPMIIYIERELYREQKPFDKFVENFESNIE